MLKAVALGVAVAAAVLLYFAFALYIIPQSYQIEPRRPEAVVTNVTISESAITLGQPIVISAGGINRGEDADMQIVSIGFPNLTTTQNIEVLENNFDQTPLFIHAGHKIGSAYGGTTVEVNAQHASIEAFSRPWKSGNSYNITLQVKPEIEGRFAIFVKSVAFPHNWEGAHWPSGGTKDYQGEFVQVHYVQVTKP